MVILAAGGAAAIYYSTIQPEWLLNLLTCLVVIAAVTAIFILPFRAGFIMWLGLIAILVTWTLNDAPSNDRDWALEYAVPATVQISGNTITIHHIRNFTYTPDGEPMAGYYDASFALDQLDTVDLISSYWAGPSIAHIFLTFGFRDGRHLAISIETRRQQRFSYSTIAGFFHHFELFYVVADERDLIGVRTDIRHEQVYLYRLKLTPAQQQRLFLSYMAHVNSIVSHPQWYNTLTDNCTTGILNVAGTDPSTKYHLRIVLSGYAPEFAYDRGLLNNSTSFAELKKMSFIARPPDAKIDDTYSQDIRANLLLGKVFSPNAP